MQGEVGAVERKAHYILRRYRLKGEWFKVSEHEAKSAICQALDRVRIDATLDQVSKTPRVDRAERLIRSVPEYAREDNAWRFARPLERELRELQQKLEEQAT
jgi:hypothetical protein